MKGSGVLQSLLCEVLKKNGLSLQDFVFTREWLEVTWGLSSPVTSSQLKSSLTHQQ
jgi:hypothetical protein